MRRPPTAYLVVFGAIAVAAVLSILVYYGVPPFDAQPVWIFSNVMAFFTLLILGVLGGAAVGMLLAHRILSSRGFTPFEGGVLEALSDIRERLDRLERQQRETEAPPERARR